MRPEPTTSAAVPAPRGEDASIHDIGYRHYDGPRLGRSYARRSLLTQSLRGAYGLGRSAKSKVLPFVLLAVMLLPAGIIAAVAAVTPGAKELSVDYAEYALLMQPVIGLYLASQAPQSVSRDLRFRTVPLYFSRPIERTDYVTAKYAAMASALFLFTAAPLVVMYAGALLVGLDFGDQTAGFLKGLVSVAVFSALHAGIGLLVAALTPRRGFGVAAVIAVLTIPYFAVTTVQAIAESQGSGGAVAWLGLFSAGSLIDGIQSALLGAPSGFPGGHEPSAAAAAVYVLVVLGLIAACWAALLARYRKAGL
ncbi:ABC transporter permease [Streptomyces glaucosporus]|uniref:ABC transporter permease n=1 Tax=Streptomyces glaucosporus TaxID=284044 RepID=A0ABP5ULX3_9ACTN